MFILKSPRQFAEFLNESYWIIEKCIFIQSFEITIIKR